MLWCELSIQFDYDVTKSTVRHRAGSRFWNPMQGNFGDKIDSIHVIIGFKHDVGSEALKGHSVRQTTRRYAPHDFT